MSVKRWLERMLSRRWAPIGVIAASLLLVGASLDTGLGADDHIHRLLLRGSTALDGFERKPLDLFRFATAEKNRVLMDQGVFPWWADPGAELGFFRPLSSLLHALDHALWPDSAPMAHLHGIAWFALGLWGLALLFARLIRPRWIATLALALYALDDARGAPIAWIANRNAIVACTLSVWALLLFVQSQDESFSRGARRLAAWGAPGLLAASLLAGEGAVAIAGYLFAHQLLLARGSSRARAVALIPCAAAVLAVLAAGRALGYGVVGSGVYLDPLAEPGSFLARAIERLPILVLGQVAGPWSDVYNASPLVLPGLAAALLGLAAAVIAAVAWLAAPLWRRNPALRFFVVGGLLSALPACATFPSDRLLGWVAIGGAGLLALLLAALLDELRGVAQSAWRRRGALHACAAIVGLHLVVAPLLLPMRARGIAAVREMLARADDSVPRHPRVRDKTVVYVNPPADPFASYVPILRADAGAPRPRAQRWLATGASDVMIERIDATTLRVRPDGGFLVSPSEQMLRSARRPLRKGETVSLSGMRVTVSALTEDGRPAEAIVRFDAPLEDERFVWLRWEGDGYVPFRLPAPGEQTIVGKVNYFEVAYGRPAVDQLRSAATLAWADTRAAWSPLLGAASSR